VRFHNTGGVGGILQFPNFNTAAGNVAGDCLWKVYPKELLYRASQDNCVYGFISRSRTTTTARPRHTSYFPQNRLTVSALECDVGNRSCPRRVLSKAGVVNAA